MITTGLDIPRNRQTQKYTGKETLLRVLWGICTPLFRFSPRPFFAWRRLLLMLFGARVGKHANIYSSAVICMPWNLVVGDWSAIGENVLLYNLGKITIGKMATISHRAHLCAGTHDYTCAELPLQKLPITVADNVWVCADAFIGPGIVVGEGAVVGARAVVMKDVPPWAVVAGNPAQIIKQRIIAGDVR